MLKLHFSHRYPKLWGQTKAQLIGVKVVNAEAVQKNKALLQYDTMFITDLDVGYYPLQKAGQLIHLVFLGNKDIPFCTMRPYTKQKFDYYWAMLNEEFEIVIEEK